MTEYDVAYSGAYCEVRVAKPAKKVGDKASAEQRARMNKLMKHLAEMGPEAFNPTQYKYEGRFPSGRPGVKDIAVYALKAHQLRFYGGYEQVQGKNCFIIEDADIKKQDKADQALLGAVAKKLGSYK